MAVEGIERLGVPGADEVLGFVPALSFGGQIRADRLSVQKAVPYLVGLAQSTPRYLGVDLMAAWGGAATQFLIDQGAIPNSTNTPSDPRSPGDPDNQDGPGGPGGPAGDGVSGLVVGLCAAVARAGLLPAGVLGGVLVGVLVVAWWRGTCLPRGLLGASRCWYGRGQPP